ncbi:MAG: hypothetical protein GY696_29320 [Gammaproteobacteria bacterium]|nr:hypothetical protein [Gammaproteobacteria bacterium]
MYNPYIASYVTSQARLHLLLSMREVEAAGGVVSYYDTDSIIYFSREKIIAGGEFLGDMKSELKPTEYIEKFIAGGPKNYGYCVVDEATGARRYVHKAKGIPGFCRDTCNFEMLERIVNAKRNHGELASSSIAMPTIQRSADRHVYSSRTSKAYRVTAAKGCYVTGPSATDLQKKQVELYPYGYRQDYGHFDAKASMDNLKLIASDRFDELDFWNRNWFIKL